MEFFMVRRIYLNPNKNNSMEKPVIFDRRRVD